MNCLTFALWHRWHWGGKIKWMMNGGPFPHFYVDNAKDNYIAYYNSHDYLKWWQMFHYEGEYQIDYHDGW